MELKKCRVCKVYKELNNFHKDKYVKFGFRSQCKDCAKKYYEEFYKNNSIKLIQNSKTYKLKSKENNTCTSCTKLSLRNSNFCIYHFVLGKVWSMDCKKKLNLSFDARKKLTLQLLGKLSNQNFQCYYTGYPLIPGINMSLEHLEAHSKNGSSDLENLVWCDSLLNVLKGSGKLDSALLKFSYYVQSHVTNEYPKDIVNEH